MRVIWKYPVNEGDNQFLVPRGEKVLKAGYQKSINNYVIWIEVDPNAEKRNFHIYGALTGGVVPSGFSYIDSVMLPHEMLGEYVVHFYKRCT